MAIHPTMGWLPAARRRWVGALCASSAAEPPERRDGSWSPRCALSPLPKGRQDVVPKGLLGSDLTSHLRSQERPKALGCRLAPPPGGERLPQSRGCRRRAGPPGPPDSGRPYRSHGLNKPAEGSHLITPGFRRARFKLEKSVEEAIAVDSEGLPKTGEMNPTGYDE